MGDWGSGKWDEVEERREEGRERVGRERDRKRGTERGFNQAVSALEATHLVQCYLPSRRERVSRIIISLRMHNVY